MRGLRGQDQFSVLRDAQLILASVVFDDDFAGTLQDVFAAYAPWLARDGR